MNQHIDEAVAVEATKLLHRLENHTELLCHVTEREHSALKERDTRMLESIAADKRAIVSELETTHKQLCQCLQSSEADLPKQLAKLALLDQWQINKEKLRQAKAKNDRNGILLNTVVARVQSELSLLTGQTTLSYKNEGSAAMHRDMGSLGRA
ncbi:flagellar export chaperone FlgN [Salinibius halmophilus]|uniref:flagellar export chaperone FlgN n=1 Tax=Salinibius halmophilus TaxID=1853216 RepID=UPI000E66880D|nr:flagellar export chaperone FlgN [Salinibius halmophilus]